MANRSRASQQWIDEAIKTLQAEGYTVVPQERHVILTVERAASAGLLENLGDEEQAKSFRTYCDGAAAVELGHGLQELGAITKEDMGPDPDCRIYRWRYRASVILPKP